jgi:hypothetical protein
LDEGGLDGVGPRDYEFAVGPLGRKLVQIVRLESSDEPCLSPDTPDFTDHPVTRLTTERTAPTDLRCEIGMARVARVLIIVEQMPTAVMIGVRERRKGDRCARHLHLLARLLP